MYYILNETKQVIAADESLLNLCGFDHINELMSSITLKKTTFKLSDGKIIIGNTLEHHTFPITYTPLSSLLGQLTLVTLTTSTSTQHTNTSMEDDIDISGLIIKSNQNDIHIPVDEPKKDIVLDNISLYDTKEEPHTDTLLTVSKPAEISNTILDFDDDIDDKSEIVIDISKTSQDIGVSEEDFTLFLNEYIDTALDLEDDLQSHKKEQRSSAIHTLLHLSDVLHLDKVHTILQNIDSSTNKTRLRYVTSFYDALSRITTTQTITQAETLHLKPLSIINDTPAHNIEEVAIEPIDLIDTKETVEPLLDLKLDLDPPEEIPLDIIDPIVDIPPIEIQADIEPTVAIEKAPIAKSMPALDLSQTDPIHFDFQVSAAADELSLPQNLIEEFMVDFIEQAHTETDKMLLAYKEGDLETVQKIGHLLKGVSSNLRITTLSDTLYKIQFCEDIDDLEVLIKDYWGHFLFFEKQISRLSN